MAARYQVRIKALSQQGRYTLEHKVEYEWMITDKTLEGICLNAFRMLLPNIRTLMYGGEFSWEADNTTIVCCPDVVNPMVFEIRRIKK
jgi:uncharacterized repeat protein (TIGR04076 family)